MDMTLTAEQDAVRKAVKEWVDDVVAPRALENDRKERFPQEALDGLKQTGFIGLSIPEEFGGGGGDPMSYVLYIEELGRGDANVRSIVSVHLGLVRRLDRPLGHPGAEGPLAAADGHRRGAGLLRPDRARLRQQPRRPAGDGRSSSRRRLRPQRQQDLHHQRHHRGRHAVHGPHRRPGAKGVSAFLVPERREGFEASRSTASSGLRSCDTAELVLRDVKVGPEALLGGEEGKGIRVALTA
jgi:alkylation response protein AidB-like acyl-CoA dehydrogenase